MWCIPELDDEYISRMEDILNLYEKDICKEEPVVGLDEKSIQLLCEVKKPIPVKENGKIKKRDQHYIRKGTANIFCCVEPKVGKYYNYVTKNKKGPEFAKVINRIVNKYQEAKTIHLVMDNYSTHTLKSLTDFYGVKMGKELWDRFTIHFTPKHGSWLNQAEIAICIYSKQCLGKDRIEDIKKLRDRTNAWLKYINKKKIIVSWKFTTEKARIKFKYDK